MVKETTDKDFDKDVLKSDQLVLVDFWAEWCGPCRMVAPIVESLANDMKSELSVYKVNIEENPEVPSQYGVRGIPTLMLFRNGKVISTKVGSLPKSTLYEWIKSQA